MTLHGQQLDVTGKSVGDFLYPLHMMIRDSLVQPACLLPVDAGCWHRSPTNLLETTDPMESRHHHLGELPRTVTGCGLAG